ncbi:MAG: hypothetical protein AAFY17_17195, partial [Cyanobacteria bacterium J06642_11]
MEQARENPVLKFLSGFGEVARFRLIPSLSITQRPYLEHPPIVSWTYQHEFVLNPLESIKTKVRQWPGESQWIIEIKEARYYWYPLFISHIADQQDI